MFIDKNILELIFLFNNELILKIKINIIYYRKYLKNKRLINI